VNTLTPLPAFSIVTAPDFFPQVDSFDLMKFDIGPGVAGQSHFFEGGTANMACLRIRPNPQMVVAPEETANTFTAVLSHAGLTAAGPAAGKYDDPALERGYYVSGYLPDSCSSIFAPGWDVTYSGKKGEIFLSTKGLGAPFVEDMKFCAALNGMWPATSPDASRTFQGGLYADERNPTSIPLMDDEIGFHKKSPSGLESFGWDGEQGPFLQQSARGWDVNFTDIRRADVVNNALKGQLDLSKLRELTSKDFISRMTCLKLCIDKLPPSNFNEKVADKLVAFTALWLISAEKVAWGENPANALGIPETLIGGSRDWARRPADARIKGDGFLFVFVDSEADSGRHRWGDPEDGPTPVYKRRLLNCKEIYVCQVTDKAVACRTVLNGSADWVVA
jgi:hypothetical protein